MLDMLSFQVCFKFYYGKQHSIAPWAPPLVPLLVLPPVIFLVAPLVLLLVAPHMPCDEFKLAHNVVLLEGLWNTPWNRL
jgi:hypothetical protein